jgi:AbrB family looped-hinge helix DNA binding protein
MYISTVKISSKGQIVLPKKVRELLGSNIISLLIDDQNHVLLTPVHELGGSLSSYKKDSTLTLEEIREQAWKENIAPTITK